MRKLRWLALLACFCASTQPVWGSTVIFRTDAQLVALSERVVHGRVVAQRTTRGGPQGRTIYTVTTLQIIEDLTGIEGATVDVWELGGRIADEYLHVGGAVAFTLGQEVLVCLERGPLGLRTVAMGFSQFDVLPEVNGERRLRRNLRDTVVVGGAVAREPFLSELRTLTARATGRPSRRGRAPQVGEELQSAQSFTLLGGATPFRWVQADSGTPVNWYINTSAASPLTSGDALTELQVALNAWTSPASASIILQSGGTTFQADADGPFTGLASAHGVITFEDPYDQISGSVLAIGGGSAGGSGGTINGTTFYAFTRGYVIFQNAANLSASFRTPPNFTRVLIHEIGHAIGLGHTQTDGSIVNATSNIMYPSCCSGSTPTPPSIGPDDLAGLTFVYPSGASSCTYSINPTSAAAVVGASSGSVSVSTQAGCAWTAASNSGFLTVGSGSPGNGSGIVGYNVAANATPSTRSGTLTIAGQTFTVNQAAACTFTLSAASTSAPAAGGSAGVNIATAGGCAWTATSNSGFLSILSGSAGTGNGSITFNATANGTNFRSGSLTIGGQAFTVYQFGTGPFVSIDRPSLRYGATNSGGVTTAQTTAQTVRLTQTSGASVSWTVTSNQPWLAVSPASGTGARDLSITVMPGAVTTPGTAAASITIALSGAGNIVAPVGVTLVTMVTGGSVSPFGVVDTPLANATGVVGAIPVTGWSLDDVEVASVFVCRAPVAGESAPADGRCGGTAQIFLGEAAFIDDARPDVAAGFPPYPRNYRGGWGYMVLTNMLPGQGNGTYSLSLYAQDREGYQVALGTRTITCNNAQAIRPFGTIDTPSQGGTASGAYVNFGWALTPMPTFIPNDGSTITVFVDGVAIGSPTYNNFRTDIATLFPGLNNTNGAIGHRVIDTTTLANGMHTIAWSVADNLGAAEGIGSRYFRVSNGVGALVAAPDGGLIAASSEALAAAPVVRRPVLGRRGWDPAAPWRMFASNSSGRVVVRSEELGRLELHLDVQSGPLTGYLRVGDALAPLPVGSRLDANTGVFTWQPGVGFVGNYDLVFAHRDGLGLLARQDVRVVLHAKGSGFVGPQVVIDTPTSQADVGQPFVLAGWAADLNAADGTGITTLHAWAYRLSGGAPVFVGAASYGGARPDVAAVHGDQFRDSGYGLVVQGLTAGNYDLAVFAWSEETADFVPARTVRVTIR